MTENTDTTVCPECGARHVVLDRLIEVLDDMGVEYDIQPAA
ncbi:hypothetical protein [Mycobacteroides abscessus]|nr:hypothetical protein [Mycobacteroides abscessus]SKF78922.1 Uncharacterised protein [Mycobacteroides abscessus subsp. bolletii]SKG54860.1 Uncharacterised protein [Mycobacteroides abscessus subsp. bolletii]SKG85125.1 Uncharacterised protein [Mycobacteroides abscessus subsp. bolletii]SKG92634.1 Uncharacterised protein [Mycobacteroides abscessus subsp. bolletii]SKH27890.1 Uncharacterised protein [Mycobacteroides abscessus subsp. bolletii]